MQYNFAVVGDDEKAEVYLDKLIKQKALCDIIKVSPKRSKRQNRYLHVLIRAFGMHFGYDEEEAKYVYKIINASLYAYKKTALGEEQVFMKSSAALTSEEMAKSIDTFRNVSAEMGYPLPPPTDDEWLREIENEIERSKYYL